MPERPKCECGNEFDGDNFCMPSACQWEGLEVDPDAFGAAGYLLALAPEPADQARCPHYGGPLHECGICAGVDS